MQDLNNWHCLMPVKRLLCKSILSKEENISKMHMFTKSVFSPFEL